MIAGILKNLIFFYQGPVFIHRVFFTSRKRKKPIANFLCFHTFYASKKRNQRGEKTNAQKQKNVTEKRNCFWL